MGIRSRFAEGVVRRVAVVAAVAVTIIAASASPAMSRTPMPSSVLATPQCTDAAQVINNGAGPLVWVPVASGFRMPCWMQQGNYSRGVWALQRALNACYNMGLSEDWDFGPRTRAALVTVQGWIGARPDGSFGPETFSKMMFSNANSDNGRPCGYP